MEKINNDNPTRIIALLTFTALLWGGNAVAAKKVLTEISPFVVTMLRFAVFSSLLLLVAGYREGRHCLPSWGQLPTLFMMGLFGTVVNNGVQFTGLMYSTAINCVVITAFGPAITGVLAAVMLNERLNSRQWLGVAISSVGVVVIASGGSWTRLAGLSFNWGDALFLFACLGWSLYSIFGRRVMKKLSPLTTTAWAGLFGTVQMLVLCLLQGFDGSVPLTGQNWAWFAYMCIGSGLMAFTFWNVGVAAIGPNRASFFINLIPLFGIVFSVLLLGETVGWFHGAAALLIIGGVGLATRG
ncbi:MAG: DMT family transporter [Veillonellaceae bacterium]|nr:DMT family transporter [Veillonellaceae bacterium]